MIAAAIVCVAVMSQAAVANWAVGAANVYNGTGGTAATDKYSGSAYFFNADVVAQKAIFDAFAADVANFDITKQTGYLATGVAASGVINQNSADNKFGAFEQADGNHNFFFVLIDGDKMYTSMTKGPVAAGGTDNAVPVAFGSQRVTTGTKLPDSSLKASEGWGQAGQWAQVAPEPTSGLLLLLGVAGLALRRRRA